MIMIPARRISTATLSSQGYVTRDMHENTTVLT